MLATNGDAAAVLRCGEDGAPLARAAVALLRSVPPTLGQGSPSALLSVTSLPCGVLAMFLSACGAPAVAAGAAPALAPLFSRLDTAAHALATVVMLTNRTLRAAPPGASLAELHTPEQIGALRAASLDCLQLLLQTAAAAAGAARPPLSGTFPRSVMLVAAGAIGLVPPGVTAGHWSIPGAKVAQEILVRARGLFWTHALAMPAAHHPHLRSIPAQHQGT